MKKKSKISFIGQIFLSCRPQRVCVKGVMSDVLTVSNGCPQGCVLSPVLFSIFTNEFTINEENVRLFKYADDMALVGLLDKTNQTYDLAYLTHTKALETWCCSSQLEMNVAKTKELIMCTKQDVICKPISLESQQVEIVEHFKYLGSILDSQLSFADNSEYIFKRCSQRLFLLRQLSGLGVSKHILELVYKSIVESVLNFHLPVWYKHLNCSLKNKLSRIVSSANKIIGRPQNQLTQLYVERTKKKTTRVILADGYHPLFSQFELLKSGRRYRVPLATKKSV